MAEQVIVASTTVSSALPPVPLSLVDLGKRLLDASKRGDTYEIRTLMSSGAPFTTDWLGTSPLHFASMHGHTDTVSILLRAGISRDARTKVDRTPLHVASQAGHFEIVQLLLKNNAIIDACDMLKMTPLHWAVENGHTNLVNLLLKNNAATHLVDKFDRTPMDIALGNMQMDIVQLLQSASNQQTRQFTNQETVLEEEVLTTESPALEQVVCTAMTNQSLSTENISATATSNTRTIQTKAELSANGDSIALATANEDTNSTVDGTGEGNTSVLAELAALAEATAPNTASSADTASWLSSRGLSLANNSAATPFTLTEAGKLALTNFMKDQGVSGDSNTVMTLVDEDGNQVLLVQQPQDGSETQTGETKTNTEEMQTTQQTTGTDLHINTNRVTEHDMMDDAVE